MPYLVFDTETTGLPDWRRPADAEGQPRLASWCMLFVDDDFEIEERHVGLVKPDGWEMPASATAINRLTNETLHARGESIMKPLGLLSGAVLVEHRTLVAHNLQFDTKIMRGEMRRSRMLTTEAFRGGICTMRALMDVCAIPGRGSGFKFPRLAEACKIVLGREMVGAHDALVDAKACLWLLRAMATRGMLMKDAA